MKEEKDSLQKDILDKALHGEERKKVRYSRRDFLIREGEVLRRLENVIKSSLTMNGIEHSIIDIKELEDSSEFGLLKKSTKGELPYHLRDTEIAVFSKLLEEHEFISPAQCFAQFYFVSKFYSDLVDLLERRNKYYYSGSLAHIRQRHTRIKALIIAWFEINGLDALEDFKPLPGLEGMVRKVLLG